MGSVSNSIKDVDSREIYSITSRPNNLSNQTIHRPLLISHLLKEGNVINRQFIISMQQADPYIIKIIELIEKKATNHYEKIDNIAYYVYDNNNTKEYKLLISYETLRFLTQNLHTTGFHYNLDVCHIHSEQNFYHPLIKKATLEGYESCMICQFHAMIQKKIYTNIDQSEYPPGFAVHIDIIENLPFENRYKYLYVAVDLCTTFTSARAYPTIDSSNAINFVTKVFSIHGIPRQIKSDFASCFSSKELENFLAGFGVSHDKSSPRKPQNNISERILRDFRSLLENDLPKYRIMLDDVQLCLLCTVMLNYEG